MPTIFSTPNKVGLPVSALGCAVLVLGLVLAGCGDNAGPEKAGTAISQTGPKPASGTPSAGQTKYAMVCLGCHGPDGRGQGPFPKLAGKSAADLESLMRAYRAGTIRGPKSATMMPFAESLTDTEIQALAAYLASL